MNPFDNESSTFYALRNEEGQYSLWPTFAAIPAGWEITAEGSRDNVISHINQAWTDMRPNSLIRAMDGARGHEQQLAVA